VKKHVPRFVHLWDQLDVNCQLGDELRCELGSDLISPLWIHLSANAIWPLRSELKGEAQA